jgi:6-phosphogluconolactonase
MPSKRHEHTEVVPDKESLVNVACELITAAAAISIGRRGFFRIALSGGSTPRDVYAALAQDQDIDWRRWHLFWGDERTVAPHDADSNYRMVKETLLDQLPIQPGIVMRMLGEADPTAAAASYAAAIEELVPANYDSATASIPRFDMILLGMGSDGHTASLFPNTPALHETVRYVVANPVPQLNTTRLTITIPLINASRRVLVLVSGADKANRLQEVLTGPVDIDRLPSQSIHPVAGNLVWLVDSDAFSKIESDITLKSGEL